ncbi:hypothetical protein MRX96_054340 [Rhipicephalus microplus]
MVTAAKEDSAATTDCHCRQRLYGEMLVCSSRFAAQKNWLPPHRRAPVPRTHRPPRVRVGEEEGGGGAIATPPILLTSTLRAASGPRNAWRHLWTYTNTFFAIELPLLFPPLPHFFASRRLSDDRGKAPRGTCVIAGEASDVRLKRVLPVFSSLSSFSVTFSWH